MKIDEQLVDNSKRQQKAHLITLNNHSIRIAYKRQYRKTQVKVRASQFEVLSAKRCISSFAMLVNEKLAWEEIKASYFYYEKELIEFALQCLYLTNIFIGECVVQRCEKKEMVVVEICPLSCKELTAGEKQMLATMFKPDLANTEISYGCDLEFMIINKQTNKFIKADQLSKNSQIGFDDAISINREEVSHPIFEIRPKPANNMIELYRNLFRLYSKLVMEVNNHQLTLVTSFHSNDRFFLGGHIHFGNIPLSFHHVRLLDHYVAIPFSLIEPSPSYERRKYYGRLGSVRKNKFQGFEYRVLPTWFKLIPDFLPVLEWIEFLLNNADKFPLPKIAEKDLKAYYQKDKQARSLEDWVEDNKYLVIEIGGELRFISFVTTLKKLL